MAEDFLCPERDELFTYSGLDLLLKRYVIQSRSRVPLETPQEMFLGIALHLAMNEGSDRMGWVKRFYDRGGEAVPHERIQLQHTCLDPLLQAGTFT